jgi:hypothetical protein
MTIVQLFHRIGRRSKGGDFTKLSMTEQTDIAEAANTGLQEVYNALPAYFKEITEGFLLPAPQPITLAVIQNSNVLSSGVFTEEQIGRSVVLDGDPSWNQVIATDRLLNPYIGATGTVNGTLYGDSVYSQRYPFDRIIGNPMFANQNNAYLMRREMMRGNQGSALWPWQQKVGVPMIWWVQMLGNSQGNEPLMVLRFAPAPSIAYSINIRMSYWPKRLTLADYDAATTLPVPDQFLESCLIPLAIRAFMSSPCYQSNNDDVAVNARAENGLQFIKNQPGQPASPNNRIFTPFGF